MSNSLYSPPEVTQAEHIITVDEVTSTSNSTWWRYMIEEINPHPHREEACPMCAGQLTPYTHMHYDSMRWTDDYPILRFTSNGLQVSNCVSSGDVQSLG